MVISGFMKLFKSPSENNEGISFKEFEAMLVDEGYQKEAVYLANLAVTELGISTQESEEIFIGK